MAVALPSKAVSTRRELVVVHAPPRRPDVNRDRAAEGEKALQVGHTRCCGIDVHQRSVVACARLRGPEGSLRREVRPFGAMTADLLALNDWRNDWRNGLGIEQVAMEATGG